ncbi:hypothetical protein DKT43_22480 [Salmonella enterica subsp. enterica serovar Stanley]|nr:hypothetical protein [Salmonella enterica subsp. enterica serovar Stanley]
MALEANPYDIADRKIILKYFLSVTKTIRIPVAWDAINKTIRNFFLKFISDPSYMIFLNAYYSVLAQIVKFQMNYLLL